MSYLRSLDGSLEDALETVVRRQVDRGVGVALDSAGDRFDRFLDSPAGQAVMDKFEGKVETALANVAYENRWNLLFGAIGFAALTAIGVSYGTKIERRGVGIAAGIAAVTLLPLILGAAPAEAPPPPARRRSGRA